MTEFVSKKNGIYPAPPVAKVGEVYVINQIPYVVANFYPLGRVDSVYLLVSLITGHSITGASESLKAVTQKIKQRSGYKIDIKIEEI